MEVLSILLWTGGTKILWKTPRLFNFCGLAEEEKEEKTADEERDEDKEAQEGDVEETKEADEEDEDEVDEHWREVWSWSAHEAKSKSLIVGKRKRQNRDGGGGKKRPRF